MTTAAQGKSALMPIPRYEGALNLGAQLGMSDSDAELLYFEAPFSSPWLFALPPPITHGGARR
jgi:hypothetical protein